MPQDKILLVEDNGDDEALTRMALAKLKANIEVNVVRDGAEAIEYLFCTGRYSGRNVQDTPRMVLLDLKLPKMDGYEVLRRIRANERTKVLPVVVFTSSEEETDIQKIRNSGANSYVVKPLDSDKFSHCVGQLGIYWLSLNQPPSPPEKIQ